MIKLTVLYSYDKALAKLSKVYGVSKQAIKDHFDDMNVELSYQTRKAFGRDYLYYMIKQSDIEECRHWLSTHKDELAKVEKPRTNSGYILDNHKDEPLHFNTQREIADFLGYKAAGFVIGRVYRGYELKRGSVPENNSIINTNTGKGITNHTIANDSTGIEVAKQPTVSKVGETVILTYPEIEIHEDDEQQPLDTTVDNNDNSMYTQKSFEENLNYNTEVEPNETIASDTTSTSEQVAKTADTPKSDFESKVEAYFSKYYDDLDQQRLK